VLEGRRFFGTTGATGLNRNTAATPKTGGPAMFFFRSRSGGPLQRRLHCPADKLSEQDRSPDVFSNSRMLHSPRKGMRARGCGDWKKTVRSETSKFCSLRINFAVRERAMIGMMVDPPIDDAQGARAGPARRVITFSAS